MAHLAFGTAGHDHIHMLKSYTDASEPSAPSVYPERAHIPLSAIYEFSVSRSLLADPPSLV